MRDVRQLPNESAKTHRFAALIGELFPNSSATLQFASGIEKVIRVETATGVKRGRADAYYGNAVIEFENSLKTTGTIAEQQLKQYVRGIWQEDVKEHRRLIAIASDGILWRTYHPAPLNGKSVSLEAVQLSLIQEFSLSEKRDYDKKGVIVNAFL